MKRISRFALMTLFSMLVLGGTHAFADPGGKGNGQGQNNQGDNNQGNHGNGGGGLVNWIDNLLNDIFGDDNNQGKYGNQGGNGGSGSWAGDGGTSGGGGTAPIDGGISLLMAAGLGLGLRKMAGRKNAYCCLSR